MIRDYSFLERYALEGRDPQLYGIEGQYVFGMFNAKGDMMSDVAAFLIRRGRGERAPKYSGPFPTEDGKIVELGEGWKVIRVTWNIGHTIYDVIALLDSAEAQLMQVPA